MYMVQCSLSLNNVIFTLSSAQKIVSFLEQSSEVKIAFYGYFYMISKQSSVKPVLSSHSKRRPKLVFETRLSLNADQKYCRMDSAILSTIKAAYSVTINIFQKIYFLFKSFVKVELSYVFTIKMFSISENCMET